jgi:hypothetical protein
MWANTSPAKKARRSKEPQDAHQPQGCGTPQGPGPSRNQGARLRPSPSERLPLRQEHLRPDHRRSVATLKSGSTAEAAAAIGKLIAERGKAANVSEVIFDRGGYLYHGRVKALADAAREGGLQF